MRRSLNDRWISGVCGAIAERYKIPSMAVRLGFAAAAWFFGLGLLTYIALWIILPSE
jgi:phage shock protein C